MEDKQFNNKGHYAYYRPNFGASLVMSMCSEFTGTQTEL